MFKLFKSLRKTPLQYLENNYLNLASQLNFFSWCNIRHVVKVFRFFAMAQVATKLEQKAYHLVRCC